MEPRFRSGDVIARREILDGREWMVYPLRVVADDGVLLAAYLATGTPITFGGGTFTWGPHPWVHFDHTWQSDGVLQLQRAGDGYSVWARFRGGDLQDWYVNFQEPLRRTADGFDTLDQELDLVIAADGSSWTWKDVDHFEERVRAGGFGPGEAEAVRAAAAEVMERIENDGRWWEQWRDWRPAPGSFEVPGPVALTASPSPQAARRADR
ncbi:DUF402 domain-containing protein [Streptomyces sp. NBC_00083]|uniref:DUF402 domain-containing protein n=1 Tax=Streptomyces sp. NBC_00083 TaxID=2975647 RepID=UPI0022594F88|nr:DUF402 domain-containing protein [Streptomyces sp. NBC_00083]MCX5387204.1 DUF402 domain-containing protein [Streptomyces sp. NBC_00083]